MTTLIRLGRHIATAAGNIAKATMMNTSIHLFPGPCQADFGGGKEACSLRFVLPVYLNGRIFPKPTYPNAAQRPLEMQPSITGA
jgi:hypothetical protein